MKNIRPFVAFLVAISILVIVVCPVQIWANGNNFNNGYPGERTTYFASVEGCLDALGNGTANYYRPTFFKLHKPASAGEEVRGLESDACVMMLTVKGYRWVAQKEGEKMVFRGLEISRRFDCGNPIRDIRYPKHDEPEPIPEKPFRCPEGTTPGEQPGVCIQLIEKEKLVEKEKIVDNTCKPGAIRELLSYHEEKKGFNVAEIVRKQLPDKAEGILALVGGGNERATSVIVLTDGCSVGVKTRDVVRKKDKWKWVWIALAAGGGFAAGYFLRPGCNHCKTQTPVKTPPTSGSPTPIRPRRF